MPYELIADHGGLAAAATALRELAEQTTPTSQVAIGTSHASTYGAARVTDAVSAFKSAFASRMVHAAASAARAAAAYSSSDQAGATAIDRVTM